MGIISKSRGEDKFAFFFEVLDSAETEKNLSKNTQVLKTIPISCQKYPVLGKITQLLTKITQLLPKKNLGKKIPNS